MIEIHSESIKGVPVLHVVKEGSKDEKLPLVFFLHGFTSAKEHNLHFGYLLAEKGFRVILPDAKLHGERSDGRHSEKLIYEFWEIVLQSIRELGCIKEELSRRDLISSQIGVVGTSMGGITMFGALTQYDWIKAGVSLMGSPCHEQLAREQIDSLEKAEFTIPFSKEELEDMYATLRNYDISNQPDLLAERPLLIWHGKKDKVVPFQPTYEFYRKIKPDYEKSPEHLYFLADEHAEHKVTREALLRTVDWFSEFLL
ncbi:esterase [Siminovitchia acidinfaciens]|uniref:Esterase n=1 Tax=Siminovitchia acidinfaciens TaxID=2321395 RepID=A0A429Y1V1_9BACI|nr:esterase [Siminovitchia acidinfaciens]RST75215.1 esterase [Siminovitchia acidinfaciens]